MGKLGYDDTPLIRDSTYCVHDPKRPAPRVIAPAETVGQAPADAVVLFDGSDLSEFYKIEYFPITDIQCLSYCMWGEIFNWHWSVL